MRHGDPDGVGVRTVGYDPVIDAAYPQNAGIAYPQEVDTAFRQEVGASPRHQDTSGGSRDARVVLPRWMANPRGYTILTACGPNETAKELTQGGQIHGALSFFLFRALSSLAQADEELTHKNLYDHLCGQFRTSCPVQNPMRYGDGKFTFFGASKPELQLALIPVFVGQGKQLCLRAGRAHGVHEGDEYTASYLKPGKGIFNGANPAPVAVRVDAVHGLSSDLSVIDPAQVMHRIETGWNAVPLTHRSPRDFRVRLGQMGDDPQWIEATAKSRYLRIWTDHEGGRNWDCTVTQNECNEYEILDNSGIPISSLPKIPICQEGAMSHILGLLEHMATFRNVKAIRNEDPATSFDEYTMHISRGLTIGDAHEVSHMDEITIVVQNISSSPLYLFMYNLGPSWQIESLIGDGGREYMVVLPGAVLEAPLEMSVEYHKPDAVWGCDIGTEPCSLSSPRA